MNQFPSKKKQEKRKQPPKNLELYRGGINLPAG